MSAPTKNIQIGSGYVYIVPYTGTIPDDNTFEVESNILGFVKDGATLKYTPAYQYVKDINGQEKFTSLIAEDAFLKFGIMTWNHETFDKITQTAKTTTPNTNHYVTKIGGMNKADMSKFLVRFVHQSRNFRITILGISTGGFEISNIQQSEAVVTAEFRANPFADGSLIILDENYSDAPDSTALPSDVLEGKVYYDSLKAAHVGTMKSYIGETVEATSAEVVDNEIVITIPSDKNGYYDGTSSVSAPAPDLGNATVDKVLDGSTFSSADGMNLEGTMPDKSGDRVETDSLHYDLDGIYMNVPEAGYYDETSKISTEADLGDAETSNVLEGKTFSSEDGLKRTGSMHDYSNSQLLGHSPYADGDYVSVSTGSSNGYYEYTRLSMYPWDFGNATAADVASGKTFTSTAGFKATGSMSNYSGQTITGGTISASSPNILIPSTVSGKIDTTTKTSVPLSSFGNATAADVASGKTFTSSSGLLLTGTASGGGGMNKVELSVGPNYSGTQTVSIPLGKSVSDIQYIAWGIKEMPNNYDHPRAILCGIEYSTFITGSKLLRNPHEYIAIEQGWSEGNFVHYAYITIKKPVTTSQKSIQIYFEATQQYYDGNNVPYYFIFFF